MIDRERDPVWGADTLAQLANLAQPTSGGPVLASARRVSNFAEVGGAAEPGALVEATGGGRNDAVNPITLHPNSHAAFYAIRRALLASVVALACAGNLLAAADRQPLAFQGL